MLFHDAFLDQFNAAMLDRSVSKETSVSVVGTERLPSFFDVTGLATASIASACIGLASLVGQEETIVVQVDQRLASLWCLRNHEPKRSLAKPLNFKTRISARQ